MAESDPNDPLEESAAEPQKRRPRQPMTRELRKFLGSGRSWHQREAAREEENAARDESLAQTERIEPVWPPIGPTSEPEQGQAEPVRPAPSRPRTSPPSPAVLPDQKISRALEMQTVALIVGAFILLGATFYAGTKIRSLKALISSRNKPEVGQVDSQKYPGMSSDELVEQALAAERLGQWREAVERLLVAKRRNVLYRDLLFRAGKICYDHSDFDGADRLLDRAIAFGEQVDTANYLRGLIAAGRNDFPAAEQFFEAAITAEPFTPGYYYYLGEALRREQRPKEAIKRYEQAASRTVNELDASLCRFKARMAKAETADRPELQTELNQKRSAGPLTIDWLLTDAALRIEGGESAEAVQLIQQARAVDDPKLAAFFSSCISDMLFIEAGKKHPEIADACRLTGNSGPVPGSTPSATPQ